MAKKKTTAKSTKKSAAKAAAKKKAAKAKSVRKVAREGSEGKSVAARDTSLDAQSTAATGKSKQRMLEQMNPVRALAHISSRNRRSQAKRDSKP